MPQDHVGPVEEPDIRAAEAAAEKRRRTSFMRHLRDRDWNSVVDIVIAGILVAILLALLSTWNETRDLSHKIDLMEQRAIAERKRADAAIKAERERSDARFDSHGQRLDDSHQVNREMLNTLMEAQKSTIRNEIRLDLPEKSNGGNN